MSTTNKNKNNNGLGSKNNYNNDNEQIQQNPDEDVYCHCKNVSYGEMIGCDNDEVSYDTTIFLHKYMHILTLIY